QARTRKSGGGGELVQILVARPRGLDAHVIAVAQCLVVLAEDPVIVVLRLPREVFGGCEAGWNVRRENRLPLLVEIFERAEYPGALFDHRAAQSQSRVVALQLLMLLTADGRGIERVVAIRETGGA